MPLLSMQELAVTFRVLGALLALPSLASLGLATFLRGTAAVSGRPAMAGCTRHSDIIVILLGGITWLLGSLAFVLASIGRMATRILAWAGVVGLGAATALFVTAHGLGVHAPWARLSAALITTVALLAALGVALVMRRKVRLFGLLSATACGLILHTLWVGYAG